MKVVGIIMSSVVLALVLIDGIAHAKPVTKQAMNTTCAKKQELKLYCDNINRDLGALFNMANLKLNQRSKTFPKTANILSNFSSIKKLKKDQIIERLYLFHKKLGDAYLFFGNKKTNQVMKSKTANIIVQMKVLAELLQNNTSCNPGQPGASFVFGLPKSPLSGNTPFPGFLYHVVVLLKEMTVDFKNNVLLAFKGT